MNKKIFSTKSIEDKYISLDDSLRERFYYAMEQEYFINNELDLYRNYSYKKMSMSQEDMQRIRELVLKKFGEMKPLHRSVPKYSFDKEEISMLHFTNKQLNDKAFEEYLNCDTISSLEDELPDCDCCGNNEEKRKVLQALMARIEFKNKLKGEAAELDLSNIAHMDQPKGYKENCQGVTCTCSIYDSWRLLQEEKRKEKEKKAQSPFKFDFAARFKKNAVQAAYSTGATQLTEGVKHVSIKALNKAGEKNTAAKAVADLLDTKTGSAVVGMAAGLGLQYLPQTANNPKAQLLADKCQQNSMAAAMNGIMDIVREAVLPNLGSALSSLPEPTKTSGNIPASEISEVELVTQTKSRNQ